jgi:hypothetical protein
MAMSIRDMKGMDCMHSAHLEVGCCACCACLLLPEDIFLRNNLEKGRQKEERERRRSQTKEEER